MKLLSPEALLRFSRNLDDAPLTDVLEVAVMVLEANREFTSGILHLMGRPLDVELFERSIKPVMRELIKRRLDLEAHPPHAARGNA